MKKTLSCLCIVLLCLCLLCACGAEKLTVYTYFSEDGSKQQSFSYDDEGVLVGISQTVYFEDELTAQKFSELYHSDNNANSVETAVADGTAVTITYKRDYIDKAYTEYTQPNVDKLMQDGGWTKE